MIINDRGSFAPKSSRTYDDKGYLHCRARVARSGVQRYYGFELGLNDAARKFKLFDVYRPDDVIFSDNALSDYLNTDITNDHPGTLVNSKNFSSLSKGTVVSVGTRDPDDPRYVRCDLLVKDAATIKDIEAGKANISAGYSADLDFTPGETPDGDPYQAIVTAIHLNHVAIVEKGRAGEARICDNAVKGDLMDVSIGSFQLTLDDRVAVAVKEELEKIQAKINDANALLDAKSAEIEKLKAKLDAANEGLEEARAAAESAKLSDADILAIVKRADATREKARVLCGESFVCDSVVDQEIISAALKHAFPEIDFSDRSPEYRQAYFDARVETAAAGAASLKKAGEALADSLKSKGVTQDVERSRLETFANAWKTGL